ncbi:MAG: hypothetical protein EAZ57_05445 [Cytophagales bacterium]|nr:MAG: hypothetical protein EAZ57_05445 [Cytophagales bacterium]
MPSPITRDGGVALPSEIEYGTQHKLGRIKIDKTEHPGTPIGSVGLQVADGYEWTLPPGWTAKFGSTTYSGTFTIENLHANVLEDVRTSCGSITSETIRVRAFLNCKGRNFSNYRELNIARPAPIPALTSNVNVANCGVTQPFAINAYRPLDATALRYEWTIPPGWVTSTGDSSAFQTPSNTITVIPTGTNGGNVTVKVTVFCGADSVESSVVSKNYVFNDQALKPQFTDYEVDTTVCAGQTVLYRIRRDFSNPATLYDWVVTGGLKFVGGLDSMRTSLDSVRVYLPSGVARAYGNVRVRAIVPECVRISEWSSKPLYGGFPERPRSLSRTVRNLCVGGVYVINILPCKGAVSYEWTTSDPAILDVLSIGTTGVLMPSDTGSCILTVRSINECGSSETNYGVRILPPSHSACGGTMWRLSPNPASTSVQVSYDQLSSLQQAFTPNQLRFRARILNNNSEVLLEKSSEDGSAIIFDVASLHNGLYYVLVESSLGSLQEQLIISK